MNQTHARPGPQSQAWFERAQRFTPGGVNSPARAFNGVGGGAPNDRPLAACF